MTDYTDLVQRLRNLHEYHAWDDDELTTYRLAADAIEQLQADLNEAYVVADGLQSENMELRAHLR